MLDFILCQNLKERPVWVGTLGVTLDYLFISLIHSIFSSVQFIHSVVSNSLQPRGVQHARLPCPSPTLGACSNSCPSSRWCHPTISSSVVPFSSCLQSFPASGSFPKSQFFTSGGQSIGVLASSSVLPMNIQDWFPLGLAGLIWVALWKAWESGCLGSNTSSVTN